LNPGAPRTCGNRGDFRLRRGSCPGGEGAGVAEVTPAVCGGAGVKPALLGGAAGLPLLP